MFIPTKQEAEISAYTLSEYRKRGIFRNLLEKAQAELMKCKLESDGVSNPT